MTEPQRPEGVRILRASGEEFPAETIYVGVIAGLHIWEICGFRVGEGDSVLIEFLPAHSSVRVAMIR